MSSFLNEKLYFVQQLFIKMNRGCYLSERYRKVIFLTYVDRFGKFSSCIRNMLEFKCVYRKQNIMCLHHYLLNLYIFMNNYYDTINIIFVSAIIFYLNNLHKLVQINSFHEFNRRKSV